MILQTLVSAITQEDAALLVNEFVAKYAPQFAPFVEKWIGIIVGVIAALSLIISLITALVKFFKSKNELKAAVTPYQFKDEIIGTMKNDILDKLNGTFDVDITAKINSIITDVVDNTFKDIAVINNKIDAVAKAEAVLLSVFKNAGSLTQEEYEAIKEVLEAMPKTGAQVEAPSHVKIELGESKTSKKEKHTIVV